MRRSFALFAAVIGAVAASACSVPVANDLSEDDANRVVVALERAGVDTTKEADPVAEGKQRVVVAREDAARAVTTLREDELPPRPTIGVLDAVGKGSLVPSALAEHAQLVAGLAGDLERTLLSIDGILTARVHLSIPEPDPLAEKPTVKSTAAVLLKYRGPTPPIDASAVQRLVSGAISGLAVDDVAVVVVPRPMLPLPPEKQIAHVGPVGVTRGSIGAFRAIAGGSILLDVALASALLFVVMRWRAARAAATPAETP